VALNQAGWQVSSIAGPAFAGLLIGTAGTAAAYGVDAASYVIGRARKSDRVQHLGMDTIEAELR